METEIGGDLGPGGGDGEGGDGDRRPDSEEAGGEGMVEVMAMETERVEAKGQAMGLERVDRTMEGHPIL